MSIDVMKQALEALDCIYSPMHVREIKKVGAAMKALRAAIEQAPVQMSVLEFVEMVQGKEHLTGKPTVWAQWPTEENT